MVTMIKNRDIYILAICNFFCPYVKTGKNLKDLKKGRENGGKEEKRKRVIKHRLKYLYEAMMTAKKSTKTGKNFREGGEFFWLARIYTPVNNYRGRESSVYRGEDICRTYVGLTSFDGGRDICLFHRVDSPNEKLQG